MKIAIIGCRGIPNQYGGFEQFAEYVSVGLVKKGCEVFVYNSHTHPYQEKEWNGVNIVHCKDPENKIGTAGQFIYDLNCIRDARKRDFDVILQLGYTSSSVWGRFLPKKAIVFTNMDGLEWKRSKYSSKVQRFLKYAEKRAVKTSQKLIADSKGIQAYLAEKYNQESAYIPYGALVFDTPDKASLQKVNLKAYQYDMVLARMEPENNIETILQGYIQSDVNRNLLVIGNHKNKYGQYLFNNYAHDKRIIFHGPLYDFDLLNHIRYYSHTYFHGHSVGGTNPSLLEAMASSCLICAHDNLFNKAILEGDAFYFNTADDIRHILEKSKQAHSAFLDNNLQKISSLYSWQRIIDQYHAVLTEN